MKAKEQRHPKLAPRKSTDARPTTERELEGFETWFGRSPDAYFVLAAQDEGKVLACNAAAERMLQAPRSLIIGRTLDAYCLTAGLESDERNVAFADRLRYALSIDQSRGEREYQRADSKPFLVHETTSVVTVAGQDALLLSWRGTDGTHQLEIELNSLYESSPDAYLVMSVSTGKILKCNRSAEDLLGGTKEQLVGLTQFQISPEMQWNGRSSLDYGAELIAAAVAKGRIRFEWLHRRLDGEIIRCDINLSQIKRYGQTMYLVALRNTDSRDRKRLEHRVQRYNKELEDFTYAVAHDLQAPLRQMRILTKLISSKVGQSMQGEVGGWFEKVDLAADRMQQLIRDLLELSRVGRNDASATEVDLKELANALKAQLVPTETVPLLDITIGDLPTVRGHRVQLQSLFQNLIDNAQRYSSAERHPRLDIVPRPAGEMVQIAFIDSGVGIHDQYHTKIFHAFFRLDTPGVATGTGIGLAICRRVAQVHGGDITVESELGRGTTFVVTLDPAGPAVGE